jgi:hypothetical protein
VRISKNRKTITFELSAWWDPDDESIHLASNESDTLIVTVCDDPKKKRGHPKLFRELTKMLKDAGALAPD